MNNNPFEFMQNLMNQDFWTKNFKQFENMNMNGFNEMAKKNSEALNNANQMFMEGMQSIMKRGADAVQKNATEMFNSLKEAMTAGDMENLAVAGQKYTKVAMENNINNTKEMVDVASKSTMEILDIFGKNMAENLNKNIAPKNKK